MLITELQSKSAIHRHVKNYGSGYGLNIYRGCEHRCKYCFAQYTHTKYLDNPDFYNNIYVKTNIAEILDRELSNKNWNNNNVLNICEVTDCYQPIEKEYKLMRDVLQILIKHKQSIYLLTKSPLVYRDYDLISRLCEVANYVNIATTITTLNETIRTKIEPNVKSGLERLKILNEFAKIPNCKTTVMLVPIIPCLTDNPTDIEELYKKAKECNVKYIFTGVLNMRGEVKTNFYKFLKQEFPITFKKIQKFYKNSYYVSKEYEDRFYNFTNELEKRYNFCKNSEPTEENKKQQMEFDFD
jgi:DNA repair photolyase